MFNNIFTFIASLIGGLGLFMNFGLIDGIEYFSPMGLALLVVGGILFFVGDIAEKTLSQRGDK